MGLPRRYRLKSRAVFNRVLKSQRLAHCPYGTVLGLPKFHHHHHFSTQFGIIISKKVHKRAHERNRLRRQLRAILLNLLKEQPDMQLARCWVVVIKPSALGQPYAVLASAFEQALRQAVQRLPVTQPRK